MYGNKNSHTDETCINCPIHKRTGVIHARFIALKVNQMKKRIYTLLGLMLPALTGLACPVCERQQPKLLQGITHGSGPASDWDYVIIAVMVAIVVFTGYFSVKMLVRPGENTPNHIKHTILTLEDGSEK